MKKTTLELIEENSTLNNREIVSEMIYSSEQAEVSFRTVWEKVAYLFAGRLCASMDEFYTVLADNLTENKLADAPTTKGGRIKFRSWPETKILWQYASTICKAVEVKGDIEEVLPLNENLPTLTEVKKMAYVKKESTAFKKCSQLLTTLNNLVTQVTNEQEKQALLQLINETVAGLK